jgi:predicted DNA-binding protein with PD1-like motif
MRKNYCIRLRLETEIIEMLKKQAEQEGITMSALCRQKLGACSKLTKIEIMVEEMNKKMKCRC